MKFTLLIPVYNAERFLEECLNSALNQTYPEIEIIAVNDGSTDNSLKILEKYSDKIKIVSKENGGPSSARNAGIKAAEGEWIKLLDADDLLYPKAVEELVSEIEKVIGDKSKLLLYGYYDIINSRGEKIFTINEPNNNHLSTFDLNVTLLDRMFANQDTVLIPKTAFTECGLFDESIRNGQDYEFFLRCCLVYGLGCILSPK